MAAAIRSGLTAGLPEAMDLEEPVSGAEAAVMIQNALDLTVSTDADLEENADTIPAWAVSAVNVLANNGILLETRESLSRGAVAQALYRVSLLAGDAPGMMVLRSR